MSTSQVKHKKAKAKAATEGVPNQPSWKGFIATPYDAALMVEAARRGEIETFEKFPPRDIIDTYVYSGAIIVRHIRNPDDKNDNWRWRDGKAWTPHRLTQDGFFIYRELVRPKDTTTPLADLDYERNNAETLTPFLGQHLARARSKENGLVKKTLTFKVEGAKYIVIAYYTVQDALSGNLPRPRHHPRWPFDRDDDIVLNSDLWNHDERLKLKDDNGEAAAPDWRGWTNLGEVPLPGADDDDEDQMDEDQMDEAEDGAVKQGVMLDVLCGMEKKARVTFTEETTGPVKVEQGHRGDSEGS
ncbi:hypothetical protein VTJ49DRAFT_5783 [Mycothermus thermophilus]|uniref:Uncharacterized protein n=1 Tax=Humicola insolens TaxID=85995 RepID=A0ABR3VQ53_HUMIN